MEPIRQKELVRSSPAPGTMIALAFALAVALALALSPAKAEDRSDPSEDAVKATQSQQAYMERQREYQHIWIDKFSRAFRPRPEDLMTGAGSDAPGISDPYDSEIMMEEDRAGSGY